MTKKMRLKNFLAVEGRVLAAGGRGQLTAEEWFYLYYQIQDDLVGVQANIFAGFGADIRSRNPKLTITKAAL
ncbi:MAG: hypothetical protein Q7S54_00290 [bacterium]|nr:hypothetical protein [bacterium]